MLSNCIILQVRKRKPRKGKQRRWLVSKPGIELRTSTNVMVPTCPWI